MLGNTLRKRRETLGLNLRQISARVGFGQSYISDIEKNNRVPRNGRSLKKISLGYELDLDIILEAVKEKLKEEAKYDD